MIFKGKNETSPRGSLNFLLRRMKGKSEAKRRYIEQCINIKFQNRNTKLITISILIAVVSPLISIVIVIFQPKYEHKLAMENELKTMYRIIAVNQDIYVDNTNKKNELLSNPSIINLPQEFIVYNINPLIQNELQTKIGLINYKFLLQYIEQTTTANELVQQIKEAYFSLGTNSVDFIDNRDKYISFLEYMEREELDETKFNYLFDSECIMHILRETYQYIEDPRSELAKCRNNSLNRIYYHYGDLEYETPEWMKPLFKEALKERKIDASWLD